MIMLAGACLVGALSFIPLSAVAFGAGVAFGPSAIPVVVATTTVGGCIAFLIARHLAGPNLIRLVQRSRTADAVLHAVDHESWRVLGLIRLSSPVPFSLASYLYGLTQMPLATFALTTFVGICPAVAFYGYLGWIGRSVLREDAAAVTSGPLLVLMLGAASLIAVAILVGRRTRAILYGVRDAPERRLELALDLTGELRHRAVDEGPALEAAAQGIDPRRRTTSRPRSASPASPDGTAPDSGVAMRVGTGLVER
jgi:uncharacterized membrane protein YdjX (TVP38/TMEM64 family)